MYNIYDLSAMSDEQLKSVAESLGIKKVNLAQKEETYYKILDVQAEKLAADSTSERRRRPTAKKEKQPAKKEAKTEQKTENQQAEPSIEEPKAEKPLAKRSPRKAKATDETPTADASSTEAPATTATATATEAEQPTQKTEPKKRNRRTKAEAQQTEAQPTEPVEAAQSSEPVESEQKNKKNPRKRIKNNATPADGEAEAIAAAAQEAAKEATEAPEADATTPTQQAESAPAEQQQAGESEPRRQQNQQNQRNQNGQRRQNDSLNSFFPRSEGKKFVPRSQREKEEAAAAQAAAQANAPITLNEPWQQEKLDRQQQQQQKNRNKKNRNNNQNNNNQNASNQQQPRPIPYEFEGLIEANGVLEVAQEGHGFLRSSDYNYLTSPDDVYLNARQVKAAGLKTGDVVECTVRPPRDNEKYFMLSEIKSVNGRTLEFVRDRVPFEHLTPLFPDEKFDLTKGRSSNISTRVVDMFSPIGKGQRGLIVAPPKTGKTILLKDIANAIAENHPETYIMILLIDERPEEVTDMSRSVNAEVIASTFDEPADRHVKIAGIVLEKAKRLVECGHDVVILLDSITRLARAYNTCAPASGKILSGGVDANALQKPKRFFGAARNIEGGGSLTIIATALTETSSKMDEVIFEEFKGTGNMELQLDRKLSNKRIFPAVDIMASSTRRDDLLLNEETLNRMWILRRFLSDRNSIESMEFIKDRMERTSSNEELLRTMGD